MCDGVFTIVAIRKCIHDLAETEVAANVDLYGAFVLSKIAPNEGYVAAVNRMLFKLGREFGHCFIGLGDDYEARGVFIYAMYEAYTGKLIEWYLLRP